jgi:haloalkane dehalogenase
MPILKTPLERFENLSGYSFQANYCDVSGDKSELLMHYLDEGKKDSPVILMLHGEPTWSYLYRNMVDHAVENGFRVIVPDLIGFGKSDKFDNKAPYTFANFNNWLTIFITKLELYNINLICQDWGGLIGLRVLAAQSQRFKNLVAANTFLPTGEEPVSEAFKKWQLFSQTVKVFPVSQVVQRGCKKELSKAECNAYDAPFPDESYKWGVRQFPLLVPTSSNNPESSNNKHAWAVLRSLSIPVLTVFGDSDPITKGADKVIQRNMKGSEGQSHVVLENVAHFIQEDASQQLIQHSVAFFRANS